MKKILCCVLLAGCSAMDAATVKAMADSQSALCVNSVLYGQISYSNMGGKSTGTAGGGGTSKCGVHEVMFDNQGRFPGKAQ